MADSARHASGRSRRRFERANVRKRLTGIHLKCPSLSAGSLKVQTLSELGMGVETPTAGKSPGLGTEMEARLVVGLTSAPVRVRLVRRDPQTIGLELIEPSELIRGAIRLYFENELAGAGLKPVEPSPKQVAGKPCVLRFKDAKANSVELHYEDDRLVRFTLRALGNRIEWSQGGAAEHVEESERAPVSDMLRNQLLRFVRSAEALGEARQEALERALLATSA